VRADEKAVFAAAHPASARDAAPILEDEVQEDGYLRRETCELADGATSRVGENFRLINSN